MTTKPTHTLPTLFLTALMLLTAGLPVANASDEGTTHHVAPGDDIQAVIDAASPGDSIFLEAGIHRQALEITTPELTIAGAGENVTILDGTDIIANGIKITANDITIRALTVQNFEGNGIFYDGVTGFLVEDVSAIRNGPYGIYAIRSEVGEFRDSFATGHADSGFYLGETEACECTIENVLAVDNLIGYSGTGAAHIVIKDSTWRRNAAGIVPNVLPNEPVPQTNLVIKDNLVESNNNQTAHETWHFSGGVHVPAGLGVVIAGGVDDLVTKNVIRDHDMAGIAISFLFVEPSLNRIVDNTVSDNKVDILWDGGGVNNCFEENTRPDGSAASFDAGLVWNTAGTLPDCDTPNAGVPDPFLMERLVTLLVFGCEPDTFHQHPTDPVFGGDSACHEHVL